MTNEQSTIRHAITYLHETQSHTHSVTEIWHAFLALDPGKPCRAFKVAKDALFCTLSHDDPLGQAIASLTRRLGGQG